MNSSQFYQFSVKDIGGNAVNLADFKGKYLLVVNTASKCGLTPQYAGLEQLFEKYKENGFVVLGFPCNQFGNQEPGDEQTIARGCLLNYGVTFPMFSKIEVNGPNAHPLYIYLKRELRHPFGSRVRWNFEKFLIDNEGRPVKRFAPWVTPRKIDAYLRGRYL